MTSNVIVVKGVEGAFVLQSIEHVSVCRVGCHSSHASWRQTERLIFIIIIIARVRGARAGIRMGRGVKRVVVVVVVVRRINGMKLS